MLDSQDSVIGDHYSQPEHAFEMSFSGVLEKRVPMSCISPSAGKELLSPTEPSEYTQEKTLDIES